jgi:hypothetical protein
MQVSLSFPPILEDPLNTGAGTSLETGGGAEVETQFHLTAHIQIGNAEVLTYVVPDLGL